MPTILGRLTAVSLHTELLIMTFLGLVNSVLSWHFFDWTIMVEQIRNMFIKSEKFGDIVKTVLSWVVVARIIIAHLYTVTYVANFYSILTWCRPKTLLPWIIVSAFKNFLLEFVVIMVSLLLYLEREFSVAWLAAFIVCKLVNLVPAIYYWRTVNLFYAELSEIQRRKSTRANLIANAGVHASRSLDSAERLRFRSTFAGGFPRKQRRFMSLVNLDDFLFNSSFEMNGERDYNKMLKSLATLITIDSQESEDLGKDSRPQIIEDSSLTPVEKSMRILGVNRDDINDTRIRLGKSVLPTTSGIEEIEEIVSTVEPKEDIDTRENQSLEHHATDLAKVDAAIGIEQNAESRRSSSNVHPKQRVSSQQLLNTPPGNLPHVGCTCRKSKKREMDPGILDLRRNTDKSLKDSFREIRSSGYEEDDDDSSKNSDLPLSNRLPLKKLLKNESNLTTATEKLSSIELTKSNLPEEKANVMSQLKESEKVIPSLQASQQQLALRRVIIPSVEKGVIAGSTMSFPDLDDGKRINFELFGFDDVRQEIDKQADDRSETTDSDVDNPKSHHVQAKRSLFRINDNIPGIYAQTDFVNDAARWNSNQDLAENECLPTSSKRSTSTQTNISDCWKKTAFKKSLTAPIDDDQCLFASRPEMKMRKFSRPDKQLKPIEDREAREMRALRVYNRRTLFKYKRELEATKQNIAFVNHAALQSLNFAANSTESLSKDMREVSRATQQGISNEKEQVRLDEIPEALGRSPPQQDTSKLSTFNVELDALEYSISLSFSYDNKNETRPHVARSNLNEKATIAEDSKGSSPSATRSDKLQTGRDLNRTSGMENIIGRTTMREINRPIESYRIEWIPNRLPRVPSETILPAASNKESCTTGIFDPDDVPETYDRYGASSLMESIRNIDWSFDDQHSSSRNDALLHVNSFSSSENVFYDIIDDTDIISLLQSAFASNSENTERGFYLGPGSTELYSVSNYLDDVVGEIMKTARLRPHPGAIANEPTTEVDYGFSYFEEFQVTQMFELQANDEESDSESEPPGDITIEDITHGSADKLDRSDPIEMCWNSYSGEGIDSRVDRQSAIDPPDEVACKINEVDDIDFAEYRQNLPSNNSYVGKTISDFLGEQEISSLEFWTNELKDLASYDRQNDVDLKRKFRHLTEMPGYCVVKTLVDFFREFVAVSRSTMTSRMFLRTNPVSTPDSLQSEEIISGGFNEHSNISLVNDAPTNPPVVSFFDVNDDEISDSLRALIDRLTESAEEPNPRDSVVIGIHDDRTTFPLREDQFYFGTPENTRRIIKDSLSPESVSKFVALDHEFIRNEQILSAFHPTNGEAAQANASCTTCSSEVCSTINTPLEVPDDEAVSAIIAEGLLVNDLTVNSYDSFYSSGAVGTTNHSDNVISIGGESPFEDFPDEPPNPTGHNESPPNRAADISLSENQ